VRVQFSRSDKAPIDAGGLSPSTVLSLSRLTLGLPAYGGKLVVGTIKNQECALINIITAVEKATL
jgi:hypothetical protein